MRLNNVNPQGDGDEEEQVTPSLQRMDPFKWFYTEGLEEPHLLGELYKESFREINEEVGKDTKVESFRGFFNQMLKDYFDNGVNYFQFTYGMTEIFRKFVIRVYIWEEGYFKVAQVQFITQYSQAEHLIPLSDLQTFTDNFQIHYQESLHHLVEIVS